MLQSPHNGLFQRHGCRSNCLTHTYTRSGISHSNCSFSYTKHILVSLTLRHTLSHKTSRAGHTRTCLTRTMVSHYTLMSTHSGLSLSHKPHSLPLSLAGDSHALQSLPHTTFQQPHSPECRGSRGLSVPTLQTQGNAPRGPLGNVVGRGTGSRPGSGRLTSPARLSGSDSRPPKRTTGSVRKPATLNLRTPGIDARVLSAQAPNFPW